MRLHPQVPARRQRDVRQVARRVEQKPVSRGVGPARFHLHEMMDARRRLAPIRRRVHDRSAPGLRLIGAGGHSLRPLGTEQPRSACDHWVARRGFRHPRFTITQKNGM